MNVSTLPPHLFHLEWGGGSERLSLHWDTFNNRKFLVQGMVLLTTSAGLCLLCHKDIIRESCLLWLIRRQQTLDVKSRAATRTDGKNVIQWHNLFGESQSCCQPSHLVEQPVQVHTAGSAFLVGLTCLSAKTSVFSGEGFLKIVFVWENWDVL